MIHLCIIIESSLFVIYYDVTKHLHTPTEHIPTFSISDPSQSVLLRSGGR